MKSRVLALTLLLFVSAKAEARTCSGFFEGYHPYIAYAEDVRAIDAALPCTNIIGGDPDSLAPLRVTSTLNRGVYNAIARRNENEMNCRAGYYTRMLDGDRDELTGAAIDRFIQLRPQFKNEVANIEAESARRLAISDPYDDPKERGMRRLTEGTIFTPSAISSARSRILAGVPFGFEPDVSEALVKLERELPDDFYNRPEWVAYFEATYRNAIAKTQNRYANGARYINGKFRSTTVNNPQTGRPVTIGGGYEESDEVWDAFTRAGSVEDLATDLQRAARPISAQTASRMVCTAEMAHGSGPREAETAVTTGIAVGALATGPAAPFIEAGVAAYYTKQMIEQCFDTPDIDVVRGQSCVETGTIQGAIQAANANRCSEAAVPAILSVGGAALTFRAAFRLVRNGEGQVVGLARRGTEEIAGARAAAGAAEEAAEDSTIVVTSTLSKSQWRERGRGLAERLNGPDRAGALRAAGYEAREGAPAGFQKYCSSGGFCMTLPNGRASLSSSVRRDLAEAYARRAEGNTEWIHPDARRLSGRNGALANPISVNRALEASESAWAKTQRYMRRNRIADTPENRERILATFDRYLSSEMSPAGARNLRQANSLRIVDAPQAERLLDRGVPRYAVDHITVDHHNSFGATLRPGQENSSTQILQSLDPASPSYVPPNTFNARYRNVASDNIGDALGVGRTIARNADRIRANPALRERLNEVALAEDFKVFGPELDLAADDTVAATLRLNDRLIPKTEGTFADRLLEGFGVRTRRAVERSSSEYDRVLLPQTDADRAYVRQLANEFRTGLNDGIERAASARIPVASQSGEAAPIYLADTTALNASANGTFEGFVTVPQYVRRIEGQGAKPIERNFTFSGSDTAPTRSMFFANMPGRGTSMLEAPAGGGRSFADVFSAAEKNAITRRLSEGRLDPDAAAAARTRLEQIDAGTFRPQSRPDGSLLFGQTYMTSAELRGFVQSDDALRALGYGERGTARSSGGAASVAPANVAPANSARLTDTAGEAATASRPGAAAPASVSPGASVRPAPNARVASPRVADSRTEGASASRRVARADGEGAAAQEAAPFESVSLRSSLTPARRTELQGKYRLELNASGESSDEVLAMIAELERRGIDETQIRSALSQCQVR